MEFQESGFAQVVYNMLPDQGAIEKGIAALEAVNAPKAASAFSRALRDVQKVDAKVLSRFLHASAYSRTSGFQVISAADSSIEKAFSIEDILELHADWLKSRSGLQILDDEEIDAQIAFANKCCPGQGSSLGGCKESHRGVGSENTAGLHN